MNTIITNTKPISKEQARQRMLSTYRLINEIKDIADTLNAERLRLELKVLVLKREFFPEEV